MTQLRILVIGTSCSGKTTLARELSEGCAIPHIELDALFWRPNWTPSPRDEFRYRVAEAVAQEEWVLDGNYSYTQDVTWLRATHLVWLNLPFLVVLWRSVKRTFGRMITGEEMWAGNRESFRIAFSRDSIIWWVISTYGRRQKRYRQIFNENLYPHLTVYEVSRSSEADGVVSELCSVRAKEKT
jgi:adenylate kinase family enzyme